MEATFTTWKEKNTILFKNLTIDLKPKEIIHGISEDILATFNNTSLIDKYDIYQHLMEYWAETMQDDMYLIAVDGWKADLSAVEGKKGEMECDLVPKYLVINRYFVSEKQAIEELKYKLDNASREIEELIEEHSGEDGYFAEFEKINKANVTARIREIKNKPEDAEELKVMKQYLAFGEQESEAKKKIKEAEKALDAKVIAKYKTLTESEIKVLVVEDKWMETLEQAVKGEMDRISQRLTGRIKELAERYATPLPTLITETETLTAKLDAHLKKMGFIW
jgi:type I restriction enzyme M protein